jgi:hypothetical protein
MSKPDHSCVIRFRELKRASLVPPASTPSVFCNAALST